MVNKEEYLNIKKTAYCLCISRTTLYKWIKAGKIQFVRHPVTHRILFSKKYIKDLMKIKF